MRSYRSRTSRRFSRKRYNENALNELLTGELPRNLQKRNPSEIKKVEGTLGLLNTILRKGTQIIKKIFRGRGMILNNIIFDTISKVVASVTNESRIQKVRIKYLEKFLTRFH